MRPHDDVFARLAQPFESHEVKARTQAGRQFHYITARTAMNRLDDVLGPANWWDEYIPAENSVLCRLTIRLPDGSTLTKSDAGGYAGMADSGDDDKSGYSDAFKRTCVKFGVARYLYRDGVPHFVQAWAGEVHDEAPAEAPAEDFPRKVGPPPETWSRWVGPRVARANSDWLREMVREGVDPHVRQEHRELTSEPREVNQLVTKLIDMGVVPAEAVAKKGSDARDIKRARDVVRGLFERKPNSVKRGVEKHILKRIRAKRVALGLPDPDAHDAADGDAAHREAFDNASCN